MKTFFKSMTIIKHICEWLFTFVMAIIILVSIVHFVNDDYNNTKMIKDMHIRIMTMSDFKQCNKR